MIRINSIIEDIKELKAQPTYRSALQITRLLESNKAELLSKMNAADLQFLMQNFEELSYASPKDHNTSAFTRDFGKYVESLLFHLNKIV